MSTISSSKILIIEDEVIIADYIQELLISEGFQNTKVAYNCENAQKEILDFKPDIILMDINLNGQQKGIDLAQHKNPEADIIYLTAQNDISTMRQAFNTKPEAYLTKPIRNADLIAAIQLLTSRKSMDILTIKIGYDTIKIKHNDILFIKSENVYLDIKTLSKTYTVRMTLEKIIQELNSPNFIKTHRSYLVNKDHITKKSSKSIFINEIEIPLSRSVTFEL